MSVLKVSLASPYCLPFSPQRKADLYSIIAMKNVERNLIIWVDVSRPQRIRQANIKRLLFLAKGSCSNADRQETISVKDHSYLILPKSMENISLYYCTSSDARFVHLSITYMCRPFRQYLGCCTSQLCKMGYSIAWSSDLGQWTPSLTKVALQKLHLFRTAN